MFCRFTSPWRPERLRPQHISPPAGGKSETGMKARGSLATNTCGLCRRQRAAGSQRGLLGPGRFTGRSPQNGVASTSTVWRSGHSKRGCSESTVKGCGGAGLRGEGPGGAAWPGGAVAQPCPKVEAIGVPSSSSHLPLPAPPLAFSPQKYCPFSKHDFAALS